MAFRVRGGSSSKKAHTWRMQRSRSAICRCLTTSSPTSSPGPWRPRTLRCDGGPHVLIGATGVRKLLSGDRVRTDERDRLMTAAGQLPDGDVDVRHRHVSFAPGAGDGPDAPTLGN